jgi:alpha-D-ribose 1-methylphosphonate 5-triphosphate synthase subunit PhnG
MVVETPDHVWTRPPEIGLIMARGRVGGEGGAFNLGEVSATRCVVTLRSGEVGHACVLGRDKAHARAAALVDALMQTDAAADIRRGVIEPLARAERARREDAARKAAATKVEFFTMARES